MGKCLKGCVPVFGGRCEPTLTASTQTVAQRACSASSTGAPLTTCSLTDQGNGPGLAQCRPQGSPGTELQHQRRWLQRHAHEPCRERGAGGCWSGWQPVLAVVAVYRNKRKPHWLARGPAEPNGACCTATLAAERAYQGCLGGALQPSRSPPAAMPGSLSLAAMFKGRGQVWGSSE